jgi:hypothetical protein
LCDLVGGLAVLHADGIVGLDAVALGELRLAVGSTIRKVTLLDASR